MINFVLGRKFIWLCNSTWTVQCDLSLQGLLIFDFAEHLLYLIIYIWLYDKNTFTFVYVVPPHYIILL